MVAGRFVNAYSTIDWTLGIIFRARYIGHSHVNLDIVFVREDILVALILSANMRRKYCACFRCLYIACENRKMKINVV